MKTHVYFMPGLAANSKIFDRIQLPTTNYESHYLEWLPPSSMEESMESYANRMCELIEEKNPILIGVSFGGILVQEMSKIIQAQKTIIISSIKTNLELPKRLRLARLTKTYKLFPSSHIAKIERFVRLTFGANAEKRITQYRLFLSVRDPLYLKWAIYNLIHWQQKEVLPNIVHIHGLKDEIFPVKNISNCIEIERGTHVMILNKAKEINTVLLNLLK